MRICTCENFKKDSPYDVSQCRLCWLFHNDKRYHNLWKEPSLIDKAVSLGKAIVSQAVEGFPETDDVEFKRRISICETCEFHNKSADSCNKCGCYLSFKAKWKTQKCPIDKW